VSDLAFEERLAAVMAAYAQVKPELVSVPVGLKDQMDAASQDASRGIDRIRSAIHRGELPGFDPGRQHFAPLSNEGRARIYLAMSQCEPCPHLGSPQRLYVRLAQYRIDCDACLKLDPRPVPPIEDADRCDWCGTRGVRFFWPQFVQQGAAILIGNACDDCNEGIRRG
jgi:hypothetical protein